MKLKEWVKIDGAWFELAEVGQYHVTIWLGCTHCLVNKAHIEAYKIS